MLACFHVIMECVFLNATSATMTMTAETEAMSKTAVCSASLHCSLFSLIFTQIAKNKHLILTFIYSISHM